MGQAERAERLLREAAGPEGAMMISDLIRAAQAHATLAVAEELRALREAVSPGFPLSRAVTDAVDRVLRENSQ